MVVERPNPAAATNAVPMVVKLTKGMNMSLSKTFPGVERIRIGLGWNERTAAGDAIDLDGVVFMTAENGKVRGDEDLIFFNQVTSACRSVSFGGKQEMGEEFSVSLDLVPTAIQHLVIGVTIYEDDARRQDFGQVRGACVCLSDMKAGAELVRFDLPDAQGTETAMILGEIYRRGGEWKFRAVGQGFAGGLRALCGHFGVSVA
ncbi:TerD family protein [uncultured Thiodictyon sp.]|uniref:TerD family protein n=1 Tax=uncultured Thiodictyon sp. TaxID=1846217 RepID=UPI0025EAD810|nr:TerD family protein [uncultured Thiodictyon sp.]